jgi:hypothetical protein
MKKYLIIFISLILLSIGCSNNETEPNNSFDTAQRITPNKYILGQNNGGDSYDYFKVTAINSAMSIGLTHLTPNASDSNFQVYVYDVSKKGLGYFNAKNGIEESMTFGVVSGNVYYMKVLTNGSPTSRQYKLSVNFSNDIYETEPNNSFNNAQQITAGEYLGQNNGSDSNDYFKVTAANNVMEVSLTHLTPGASDSDFQVHVYDVSKKDLGYIDAKNGINKNMNFKIISGDSYYIRILTYNSDSNRQYKLKIAF